MSVFLFTKGEKSISVLSTGGVDLLTGFQYWHSVYINLVPLYKTEGKLHSPKHFSIEGAVLCWQLLKI